MPGGRIDEFQLQVDSASGAPLGICWITYEGDDKEGGRIFAKYDFDCHVVSAFILQSTRYTHKVAHTDASERLDISQFGILVTRGHSG
jgi:hypothetical protein